MNDIQKCSPLQTADRDLQCAQWVLQGKQQYWDVLYTAAYKSVLHRVASTDWYHLLSYHEHRDLADEAFARCYAQLSRYNGAAKFQCWVGKYAEHLTLNRLSRERTKRKHQQCIRADWKTRAYEIDPLVLLIKNERDAILWRIFSRLRAIDRQIVNLRLFEQYSFVAVSQMLCMPRRETLMRYRQALCYIRKHYIRLYAGVLPITRETPYIVQTHSRPFSRSAVCLAFKKLTFQTIHNVPHRWMQEYSCSFAVRHGCRLYMLYRTDYPTIFIIIAHIVFL